MGRKCARVGVILEDWTNTRESVGRCPVHYAARRERERVCNEDRLGVINTLDDAQMYFVFDVCVVVSCLSIHRLYRVQLNQIATRGTAF